MLLLLAACSGAVPSAKVQAIDMLNEKAYDGLYRNLDTASAAAQKAYEEAGRYRQGKAEAANNWGMCCFMAMDFGRAEALFKEVPSLTSNEVERLIADVWDYAFTGESRTVDVHVRTLRQKLGAAGSYIETVRGYGYKIALES